MIDDCPLKTLREAFIAYSENIVIQCGYCYHSVTNDVCVFYSLASLLGAFRD